MIKNNSKLAFPHKLSLYISLCLLSIVQSNAQNFYTINDIIERALFYSPEYNLNKIQNQIDKNTYEISMTSLLPSISMSILGPSYSKTISPVSQSDGSLKYLEVNNWQDNFSLNAAIPIEFTGGQLSLISNLSMYKNNRDNNTSTSYSANYYHLSLNQPLDFFSINKWNRRITKATRDKSEIQRTEYLFELKYYVLQLFFEALEKDTNIKQLEHQKYSLHKLHELSKVAYSAGKVLETDRESIALKIENCLNQIELSQEELIKTFKLLNIETKLTFTIPETTFICPELPFISIDTDVAISQLCEKIEKMYRVQLLSQKRTNSQLRNKRWVNASLSTGVGLSASANNIKQLSKNRITDYNISLNFTFPITSWSSQKKEYINAKLNYEKLLISKQKYIEQQKVELLGLIANIKLNCKTYNYLLNKKQLLQKEKKTKQELFKTQRILFNELEDTMDEELQNELNLIHTIANIYLDKCEIERKIEIDFTFNRAIY